MDQRMQQADRPEMHDGEDFVCPTCSCEIMVKHHGDPNRMPKVGPYTCSCGTEMRPEHQPARAMA
jgi:hypothetical protein